MIFQLIAVTLLTVFYGCYFTKMICQKKQGIQTDQMGKGKTGFVKFVEISTKTAAIIVTAAEVFSIFMCTDHFSFSIRIAGGVTGLTGTLFFVIAVLTMQDSWRAGVDENHETELVTKGIYQISRNPAFLGFDLLYIGILMMFFNWILLASTVFAVVMYHLQIVNVEEEFLIRTFGNDYLNYKKKVCRYFGRKF